MKKEAESGGAVYGERGWERPRRQRPAGGPHSVESSRRRGSRISGSFLANLSPSYSIFSTALCPSVRAPQASLSLPSFSLLYFRFFLCSSSLSLAPFSFFHLASSSSILRGICRSMPSPSLPASHIPFFFALRLLPPSILSVPSVLGPDGADRACSRLAGLLVTHRIEREDGPVAMQRPLRRSARRAREKESDGRAETNGGESDRYDYYSRAE